MESEKFYRATPKSAVTILNFFCSNINPLDLCTLYTTIPHTQLQDRLHQLIKHLNKSFFCKNWKRRYKFLVLGFKQYHVVKSNIDSNNTYAEEDMLDLLIDKIFLSSVI